MLSKLRRVLKWSTLVVLAVTIVFTGGDSHRLNPAQEAATPYIYDLVAWEATNFLSKWVHRLTRVLPWNSLSKEEKRRRLEAYFDLGEEVSSLQTELSQAAARTDGDQSARVIALERKLAAINARRDSLRDDVEETIEAAISSVVSDEGFASWGKLMFPPVDIRLSSPPRLLVTSPRDRIERTHDVLLKPQVTVQQREEVEDKLLQESDLSAAVISIGGIATYPASLPNNRTLQATLQTSAHEWLHHYFFFRPLGQNMFHSDEMETLNETAADIAGREIGDRAFEKLMGVVVPAESRSAGERVEEDKAASKEDGFDFDREMRATRRSVDELLAAGKVEEAEVYMEQRRQFFVENKVYIRKLNQAYFAFHSTYAESPTSVSPIGDQLHQFRERVPDLRTFVRRVAGMSSYEKFLEELDRLERDTGAP